MPTLQELIAKGYTPEQAASLMGKSGGNSAVLDAINATAARAGMDPKYWRAVAQIESRLTPSSNIDKTTQYKGLFQVGSRGPDSEWARHGRGSIYDPLANAQAAAELAAANNTAFTRRFGRAPTPAETYLMHQQGLGFFTRGAMTNIAGNLPKEARTPENMTHEGFQRWWTNRLEREAGNPIDPNYKVPDYGYGVASETRPGSVPAGATASAAVPATTADSTEQRGDATKTDLASALGAVTDKIAKEQEASTPQLPPLPQMQPMMTPAMQRARLMAQAMLARQMGITDETST